MKISFIGAGKVAQSIARLALEAGHEVILSSRRGPKALSDTVAILGEHASVATVDEAARGDLVILCVPWLQVEAALEHLPDWAGRILVDATNPFSEVTPVLVLADLKGVGASEIVAAKAPGARVVKAFNAIRMEHFDQGPAFAGAKRVIFVSGDDADAKARVTGLINDIGFEPADLGGLVAGGRTQQAGGPLAGRDWLIAP